MKRNLLCYGLALIGAVGFASSAGAQTQIYSNDFSTQDLFSAMTAVDADENATTSSGFWRYNSYGTKYAYISSASDEATNNDYLVTPVLELEANHQYILQFRMIGMDYDSDFPYSVDVLLGKDTGEAPSTGDSFADYSTLGSVSTTKYGGSSMSSQPISEIVFVTAEAGEYRIAFWANQAGIALDDITITDNGSADAPVAVTDLTLTMSGNSFNLTWSPSTARINGATDVDITYEVVRVLDGEETIVVASQTATEFSEEVIPNGIQSLSYKVTAIDAGTTRSSAVESVVMTIGSQALPFEDSFADGVQSNLWSTEIISGSYNWEIATASNNAPTPSAQDDDNGLAYYCSYSATKGDGARLITVPLQVADNPVVQFYLYHYSVSSSYTDKVKIQVSKDGGEWQDVENAEFIVESGDAAGWAKHSVNIADAVAGCTTFRVALTTVSARGYNTVIDNVKIFNFSGVDAPNPVTDLAVTAAGNVVNLSWTAPTTGEMGSTDLNLTYEVVRIMNDEETIVAEALTETTFTDQFDDDGAIHVASYKVTPINQGSARGESTTSASVKVGALELPFADSFADGVFSDLWETEKISGSYNWVAAAQSNKTPTATPQDEDGGLAYFESYTASRNNSARLSTVPLKVTGDPTVSFYFYHTASTSSSDVVKIQVSKDGGDWEDVAYEDATAEFKNGSTPSNCWNLYTVPLADAVDGATTFRVAFVAVSNYNNNLVIDNVNIYNVEPFTGTDTPRPVTDLAVSASGNTVSLSWTAPSKGINGVKELELTYDVARVVNGEETLVSEGQTETTFTEEVAVEGLMAVSYIVTPINCGTERGESTTSATVKLGSMDLPFEDSFADGVQSDLWDTEIVSGSYNWVVASASNKTPQPDPQDADGGLAYYQSYSASSGCGARLITAPLTVSSSTNPFVQFYLYHYKGYSSYSDKVKIEVSKDGGDWQEVEGAAFVSSDAPTGQWVLSEASLAAAIEGATTYRVSLTAVSGNGYNLVIDNVKVINKAQFDIQAVSVTGPAEIKAGFDAEYVYTIKNEGAATVAADDYSLEITCNGAAIEAPESVEIASGSTIQLTLTVPYDATNIGGEYTYSANIVYSQDEVADNNQFDDVVTAVSALEKEPLSGVEGSFNGEDVTLAWTNPVDLTDYQPISIQESFEDFDTEAGWPYNGFTVYDGDETPGISWYGFASSVFTLFEPTGNSASYAPSAKDGSNVIGVNCGYSTTSDDWLISPELNCHPNATINFSFWIYTRSSQYASYEVRYSTTTADVAEFTNVVLSKINTLDAAGSWTQVAVSDIPASAKYIAIHVLSESDEIYCANTLIDLVEISDSVDPVIGFNVYEEGFGRVNDELIPATETTYTVQVPLVGAEAAASPAFNKAKADDEIVYNFSVTAVYAGGETAKSNIVEVKVTTGVEDVAIDANDSVEFFNLQGVKVVGTPAPGIYIRRQGNVATKVLVK